MLSTDIDDLDGESIGAVTDALRAAGALDVVLLQTTMKKGRPGTRIDALCSRRDADRIEELLLLQTTTAGVRRLSLERRALPRREAKVEVAGHAVRVKVTELPGGGVRAKPEFDDVARVAAATGRSHRESVEAARRLVDQGIEWRTHSGELILDGNRQHEVRMNVRRVATWAVALAAIAGDRDRAKRRTVRDGQRAPASWFRRELHAGRCEQDAGDAPRWRRPGPDQAVAGAWSSLSPTTPTVQDRWRAASCSDRLTRHLGAASGTTASMRRGDIGYASAG
jgi:hypothetical protein